MVPFARGPRAYVDDPAMSAEVDDTAAGGQATQLALTRLVPGSLPLTPGPQRGHRDRGRATTGSGSRRR